MKSDVLNPFATGAGRVLIIRLRSLGDCVLSTPAIHLLKSVRPGCEIAVVVEPQWRAVYEGNPDISAILPPTHRAVRDFQPDVCLDFHGGNTAARLTFFSGAKCRAGFAHNRLRGVYTVQIPRAQSILQQERTVHTAEHMASAMFHLGVPPAEIPRACLFAEPAAARRKPYAVVHPVAATPEKTWPAAGFLAIGTHVREQFQLEPVFIGAQLDDLSAFTAFETVIGAPLAEVKSLIAGASMFIGNDSGPAHMAAAFGVPPVVIFGPSDPMIWGPWRTGGEVIKADGPIHAIPVQRVMDAAGRLSRMRVLA